MSLSSDKLRPLIIICPSSKRRQKWNAGCGDYSGTWPVRKGYWTHGTPVLPWVPLSMKYLLENALFKIKAIPFTSDSRLRTHLKPFRKRLFWQATTGRQFCLEHYLNVLKIIWKLNRSAVSITIICYNHLLQKSQVTMYIQCTSGSLKRNSTRL